MLRLIVALMINFELPRSGEVSRSSDSSPIGHLSVEIGVRRVE